MWNMCMQRAFDNWNNIKCINDEYLNCVQHMNHTECDCHDDNVACMSEMFTSQHNALYLNINKSNSNDVCIIIVINLANNALHATTDQSTFKITIPI